MGENTVNLMQIKQGLGIEKNFTRFEGSDPSPVNLSSFTVVWKCKMRAVVKDARFDLYFSWGLLIHPEVMYILVII